MGIRAFILISVEPAKTKGALLALSEKEGIISASIVAGRYDIVLEVEAKDIKSLSDTIIANIRTVDGVRQTETLVVTERR
jgi:DNA-binding Lrp family transcriptional regulator